ncbi:MAG: HAMP domain-containing histidine kinase [Ruminococcus sp.]|nr:HAMP domain-containing histidine kinase [Ruminococcus sp.]
MKYKPFIVGAVLSLTVVLCTLVVFLSSRSTKDETLPKLAVEANEVVNLIEAGDTAAAAAKAAQLRSDAQLASKNSRSGGYAGVWIVCGAAVLAIFGCVAYVWRGVIRPFHRLEGYADRLAAGDFDTPLDYERDNYFGKFTWAFDSMRREIVKARSCEREAIDNNKTVIASLSHDLKTPLASITAYSEALVNGLYSDQEEMYRFLGIISSKCGEVARLTNDMMTHSISELGALKMQPENIELCGLIEKTVSESAARDIRFEKPMFPVRVYADRNRLTQLFGNLIGNAQKYAGGKAEISISKENGFYRIRFQDHGGGIPDGDLPFIFDKFYRGANAGDVSGSGLGLYIVRYIARQSGGEVYAENAGGGLLITVELPEETLRIS